MDANDVVNFLGNMSVMDLIDLTHLLENKWQLKAEPQVQQIRLQQTTTEVKAEQTEFSVVLVSCPPDKKIAVIKCLRDVSGLGLVECKNIIEKLPQTVKENLSKQDAEGIKMKLDEAGAKTELK
jgi:large subunit ribosomal protein L7/L12